MTGFFTLMKKELRLMRNFALGVLVAVIIGGLLDVRIAYDTQVGAASILLGTVLMVQGLYLPFFMWISLRKEWRRKGVVWLHLPQSGQMLLFAKLLSGFVYMLLTVLVTALILLWVVNVDTQNLTLDRLQSKGFPAATQPDGSIYIAAIHNFPHLLWLAIPFVLYMGLYIAIWVMTMSISVQACKHSLRKARWLVGIGIAIIATWGMDALESADAFQPLFHWGSVSFKFIEFSGVHITPLTFYAGQFVIESVILAALFALCSWLLDRKVEV
jgi:hypothetical protein